MIKFVQSAFNQGSLVSSLPIQLVNPTVIGNIFYLYMRFSPLTGTPILSDNFSNKYKILNSCQISSVQNIGFWTTELKLGGANHTIIALSQGGPQNLEIGVSELCVLKEKIVDEQNIMSDDILYAIYNQSLQQTSFLKRLVIAERA